MRMIYTQLPAGTDDNRIRLFFDNLEKEFQAQGGYTSAQLLCYCTEGNSIPDFLDSGQFVRIPLNYEILTVLVYEESRAERITTAIGNATKATWPERDDIRVMETISRPGRSLSFIRGGKTDS